MINFTQYLTEARMAPLYHGTNVRNLDDILSNGLMPKTFHSPRKLLKGPGGAGVTISGVSTTRSLKFAQNWTLGGVVLVLDQDAISRNYEIKPIQYFFNSNLQKAARDPDYTGAANEYEEFIITNKNIPVKYIKSVLYLEGFPLTYAISVKERNIEFLEEMKKKYRGKVQFHAVNSPWVKK